jgi:hypothetical protein
MRTTVDLPDDLYRQAKATAALRGLKLKELITAFVEEGLEGRQEVFGHREPIPVPIPPAGRQFVLMSNAEILELIDREDDETKP